MNCPWFLITLGCGWITARQKDKATESVTELVGAFKSKPPPTPALQPIAGDFSFVSPLPLQSPMLVERSGSNNKLTPTLSNSSEPFYFPSSRTPKLSGVTEHHDAGRSKRTSGFLSLLGYVLHSLDLPFAMILQRNGFWTCLNHYMH